MMEEAHHTHASRQAAELLRVAVESERWAVSRQKRARQTLQTSGGFCEVPLCRPDTHKLSQKATLRTMSLEESLLNQLHRESRDQGMVSS